MHSNTVGATKSTAFKPKEKVISLANHSKRKQQ